jgi:hypothetical protein
MTFITVWYPPGESAQSIKRGRDPRGTPPYPFGG